LRLSASGCCVATVETTLTLKKWGFAMGAAVFACTGIGPTVNDAFNDAVRKARYECGHGGYTGTIAEKSTVVMVADAPMSAVAAASLANELINADDERISEKGGPAGAIQLDTGGYFFFGWASG
jgi:hypothetical protein